MKKNWKTMIAAANLAALSMGGMACGGSSDTSDDMEMAGCGGCAGGCGDAMGGCGDAMGGCGDDMGGCGDAL